MEFLDTVLESDDRSYFTYGQEEHLLLPVTSFKSIQNILNNIQLLKKSFNTDEHCQNINFKPIDISAIVYLTI